MKGLRFQHLESLKLAVTGRIQQLNKLGICDDVKKLSELWKRVTKVKEEYTERM